MIRGMGYSMAPEIEKLILHYPQLTDTADDIDAATRILIDVYSHEGKVMVCGNGGSAADCEHIVGELLKEFKVRRPFPEDMKKRLLKSGATEEYLCNVYGALPAVSLASHIGFITAFNNDANADYVFAQQLYALGNSNDALLAISTSGNSRNVVNAAIMAKAKGIQVIGLTGATGGRLSDFCDITIKVPEDETARIQEMHLPIYHVICELIERYFFVRNT